MVSVAGDQPPSPLAMTASHMGTNPEGGCTAATDEVAAWREMFFRWRSPRAKWPSRLIRQDETTLATAQQRQFIDAYRILIDTGALERFIVIHSNMAYGQHLPGTFLPWHRVFIYLFEQYMQAYAPGVGLPYWDWTRRRAVPPWLIDFRPQVYVDGRVVTVWRREIDPSRLPTRGRVARLVRPIRASFTRFEPVLMGLHDNVHLAVGGPMASIAIAPTDPLFWLHHAAIDRIWATWQSRYPGLNPSLAGGAAMIGPWKSTEPDTRDVSRLGYGYDVLVPVLPIQSVRTSSHPATR